MGRPSGWIEADTIGVVKLTEVVGSGGRYCTRVGWVDVGPDLANDEVLVIAKLIVYEMYRNSDVFDT